MVPKLEAGDQKAKEDFNTVLQDILLANLQEKKKTSCQIAAKIKAFHNNFQPLCEDFQTDFVEADAKIRGDNDELKQLTADRIEARSEVSHYEALLVTTGAGFTIAATMGAVVFYDLIDVVGEDCS